MQNNTSFFFFFAKVPVPLKCYNNGSFYNYLKRSFLSFGFPNVSTFVSLLPTTRKSEVKK